MANILFAVYKKTWKSDRWNLNYFMSLGSGQGCHFCPSFLSFYNCFIMYLSDFYSSNMPYSGTQWQIPFYWTGVFSSFVNFSCVWRWPAEGLGPPVWSQQPFFWHSFSEEEKKLIKPINGASIKQWFFFYWGITKWGSRKGIKYIFFFSKFKLWLEFKKHSHHFFWCKQFVMILATNQKEHN